MNSDITVRFVRDTDAGELLAIYAPYVKETPVTFEYDIPSLSEFENRIRTICARYPYLVACKNDKILGYTYASAFKDRAAYDWSVETSIYVSGPSKGLGIGTLLYQKLEELLKKQNICNLCACIAYPNPESIAFHEKSGFSTVAHFHKSGYKFNTWYDMVWMEKFINEHTDSQKPFIPIKEVL